MLEPAQLYETELKKEFAKIALDDKYKYLRGCTYADEYVTTKSTWNTHEFVSTYKGKQVLGYFKYDIDRELYSAHSMKIVNFQKTTFEFSKDLKEFLKNIFDKFSFMKLSFACVVGNPIENTYDLLCNKYGGRIIGIKRDHCKLSDGKLYDLKMYEILKRDYDKRVQEINRLKFCKKMGH